MGKVSGSDRPARSVPVTKELMGLTSVCVCAGFTRQGKILISDTKEEQKIKKKKKIRLASVRLM